MEARTWLKNNKNRSAFAGNRFGTTENALKFVNQLYELGAEKVEVTDILNEDWRIKSEGGPYAESLIISLPDDLEKRKALFECMNREIEHEGFDPVEDLGQASATLWWD